MKRIRQTLALLLTLMLALSSFGGAAQAQAYAQGTYSASETGMNGEITVTLSVADGKITAVEIGENAETEGIGSLAVEELPKAIIEAQSAQVDTVAGATITSKAILAAAKRCIRAAQGMPDAAEEISFTSGTYTAQAAGMRGPFDVTVTFGADSIESIETSNSKETAMVGTEALRILKRDILDNQSLGVDSLSGATVTSRAFISAVEDCVEQAGGSVEALKAVPAVVETYADKTHTSDILVVGGGLAGVTAAISAYDNGGDVIMLEAKRYLGGNSVLATGLFLLGGTSIQKELGVEDDSDSFFNWIVEHGKNEKDPVQARWIADNGQNLIDFMTAHGYEYNQKKMNVTDGSDVTRTHLVSPSSGVAFSHLADYIAENNIDVRYATKAREFILNDDGEILGVRATDAAGNDTEYYANKIVLACGGFGNNSDLIAEYWGEEYRDLVYGGSKGMDGTMLVAARDQMNAGLATMDDLHIDATLEVTHGITVTTTVLGSAGGILVRQSTGKRFVDEAGNHSEDAADMMHDLGDEYYYEIFDQSAFDVSETVAGRIQAYVDMGLTNKFDSVSDMANFMRVDESALNETIEEYNAVVRGEIADPFGRDPSRFFQEMKGPYYVMKVANGVACTTGGLTIDGNMQVLNVQGEPIAHLYAVGEITGGYLVYYVGGDSLSRSSIGGMVLGKRLAAGE